MMEIRISCNDLACRQSCFGNLTHEVRAEKSFAVIFENHGIDFGQLPREIANNSGDMGAGGGPQALAVNPDDLLISRDDACLNYRRKAGICYRVADVDLL